jgi:Icc protein
MRLLQLSDPHLLADPRGYCRGRQPWQQLRSGALEALAQAQEQGPPVDLLLISGDLCHDESWSGYALLRDCLGELGVQAAFLPGNHDHPQLMRSVLGRHGAVAPALVPLAGVDLVLLDSHRAGCDAGWLGANQLAWLNDRLAHRRRVPLLVALHHPPVPIGDAGFDAMALVDAADLWRVLQGEPQLRAVLFGHIHQHWQGTLPGQPQVALLGCPSSLCAFGPVQPCPLGRPQDPGGRLVDCSPSGALQQRLLRWSAFETTSVARRSAVPHTGC